MRILAGLAGGFAACVLLLLQVIPYGLSRPLTPVDEIGHIDYAIEMSVGHWPRWGDQYTQQTLFIADCAGNSFGPSGSCAPKERIPQDYWPNGWSYEAQQPPMGYLAHAVVARAQGLAPPGEQLSWLRGTSLLLTCAGLALVGLLAGFLAPSSRVAFAASTPIALLPTVVNSSQFVTNDAATLAAGVIAIVPGLVAMQRPTARRGIVFASAVLTGLLVALIKPVALSAVIAMLAWSLLPRPDEARRRLRWRPATTVTALQLAAGAIAAGVFAVIQGRLGSVPSSEVMRAVLPADSEAGLPLSEIGRGLREAITLTFQAYDPVTEFRNGTVALVIAMALAVIFLIAALPGPMELRTWNWLPVALGAATVAVVIGWTMALYLWEGFAVVLPSRYLLALSPLLALLSMKAFSRMGRAAWAVPALAILGVIVMVYPIIPLWLGWSA